VLAPKSAQAQPASRVTTTSDDATQTTNAGDKIDELTSSKVVDVAQSISHPGVIAPVDAVSIYNTPAHL
jgi:phosphoenolpyruvate synthase/pyruvate phosphate dikinase